jgi:hypothetical protein
MMRQLISPRFAMRILAGSGGRAMDVGEAEEGALTSECSRRTLLGRASAAGCAAPLAGVVVVATRVRLRSAAAREGTRTLRRRSVGSMADVLDG